MANDGIKLSDNLFFQEQSMWKNTLLKNETDSVECLILAPSIAELMNASQSAKHARLCRTYAEDEILYLLVAMNKLAEQGKLEPTYSSYLKFAMDHCPTVTEETLVPNFEDDELEDETLGHILKVFIEEIEQREPEEDGEVVGYDYVAEARKDCLVGSIPVSGDGQVSDQQAKALDYVEANQEDIFGVLKSKIVLAASEFYDLSNTDDLLKNISCVNVGVTSRNYDGMSYVEYCFMTN
ncbi:hypothetical protein JD969_16760 [Planctomycetota bacterium]|nr:hypothetical protein JD969_16760 [Planctomycetota bacterium]